MPTVSVLRFPDATGADEAFRRLNQLQRKHLINLHDAATVAWPAGAKTPTSRHLAELSRADAMGERFWEQLFGQVFAPLLGTNFSALGGSLRDWGLDDDFIEHVRTKVTEGSSALVLMTSGAVIDRVVEAMDGLRFEVIATSLSKEQTQKLREAFHQS